MSFFDEFELPAHFTAHNPRAEAALIDATNGMFMVNEAKRQPPMLTSPPPAALHYASASNGVAHELCMSCRKRRRLEDELGSHRESLEHAEAQLNDKQTKRANYANSYHAAHPQHQGKIEVKLARLDLRIQNLAGDVREIKDAIRSVKQELEALGSAQNKSVHAGQGQPKAAALALVPAA